MSKYLVNVQKEMLQRLKSAAAESSIHCEMLLELDLVAQGRATITEVLGLRWEDVFKLRTSTPERLVAMFNDMAH